MGCLSERLGRPAVTTEISIFLTHARSTRSASLCACSRPRLCVRGERVRVRIDIWEIWIRGDIDQVECSQGERLVLRVESGCSGKAGDCDTLFSLRRRRFVLCRRLLWMIVDNMSFSTCL